MNNELEKRLRKLAAEHLGKDPGALWLLREAARIGAEIEREECARVVHRHHDAMPGHTFAEIESAIRARRKT